jgi:uncharacterized membrane protein
MIRQNRQAEFQRAKADHDFVEEELELRANTELTRAIHALALEIRARLEGRARRRHRARDRSTRAMRPHDPAACATASRV